MWQILLIALASITYVAFLSYFLVPSIYYHLQKIDEKKERRSNPVPFLSTVSLKEKTLNIYDEDLMLEITGPGTIAYDPVEQQGCFFPKGQKIPAHSIPICEVENR